MTAVSPRPPLSVNHVGITVPDVFGAIDWYGQVFSLRCIMGPRLLEPASHQEARSALGPRFTRAWQAHLLAANGVGLELFQFLDPPVEPRNADTPVPFTARGPWHVCLTHPDVADVLGAVARHGGMVLSEAVEFVPGRPWTLAYVTDPWGTVLEIMSHSYAEVFANWPQPGQLEPPVIVPRPHNYRGVDQSRSASPSASLPR
jgi:predicted enzyme related to lactoylglutathione lyase